MEELEKVKVSQWKRVYVKNIARIATAVQVTI